MIANINLSSPFITLSKYQVQHGEDVSIGLDNRAESAIHWAMMKMDEEARIAELARSNPTVADAAQALKTAEEQLRLVMALVR